VVAGTLRRFATSSPGCPRWFEARGRSALLCFCPQPPIRPCMWCDAVARSDREPPAPFPYAGSRNQSLPDGGNSNLLPSIIRRLPKGATYVIRAALPERSLSAEPPCPPSQHPVASKATSGYPEPPNGCRGGVIDELRRGGRSVSPIAHRMAYSVPPSERA